MVDHVSEITPWKRPIIETCREIYEYPKHYFLCTEEFISFSSLPSQGEIHQLLHLYTDGSKTRDGVRYAVTDDNTSITGKIAILAAINYSMYNRPVVVTRFKECHPVHKYDPLVVPTCPIQSRRD